MGEIHSYRVFIDTRAEILVYAATSEDDALNQAVAMAEAVLDTGLESIEMNHGRVYAGMTNDIEAMSTYHDENCISPEHDDKE